MLAARHPSRRLMIDVAIGAIVLLAAFAVFRSAPIQQAGDSRYTMLLADTLWVHHTSSLERYNLPSHDYRLVDIGGHRYYSFPPGSAVLSVPFVALMRARGIHVVSDTDTYNQRAELVLDAKLAAVLMAAFAALAYFTARIILPIPWSVALAIVAVFGTQVFSTASRSMWSDTWGITLVGFALFLLLQSADGTTPLRAALLGTLVAGAYVVRPTNSIVMVWTVVYVAIVHRSRLWLVIAAAAFWLGVFFTWSWTHYGRILPPYFAADRLQFASPLQALFGNLISPSRGLLVYVPAVVPLIWALMRYRRAQRYPLLVHLAVLVVGCHFVMLAGFVHWWGGYSYGARLTTSLVPCFVLLGVIAVDAARRAVASNGIAVGDVILAIAACIACALSIVINGIGAFSREADKWNAVPESVDAAPARLWSWARPQFASPFVETSGPYAMVEGDGLRLGTAEADKVLGSGWANGEGEFRWTDGRRASTIRFSASVSEPPRDSILELDVRPYLADGKLPQQRLLVSVNDCPLAALVLGTRDFAVYRIHVPANVLRAGNVLRLGHPDAASPAQVEGLADSRLLGVAVRSIALKGCNGPSGCSG